MFEKKSLHKCFMLMLLAMLSLLLPDLSTEKRWWAKWVTDKKSHYFHGCQQLKSFSISLSQIEPTTPYLLYNRPSSEIVSHAYIFIYFLLYCFGLGTAFLMLCHWLFDNLFRLLLCPSPIHFGTWSPFVPYTNILYYFEKYSYIYLPTYFF